MILRRCFRCENLQNSRFYHSAQQNEQRARAAARCRSQRGRPALQHAQRGRRARSTPCKGGDMQVTQSTFTHTYTCTPSSTHTACAKKTKHETNEQGTYTYTRGGNTHAPCGGQVCGTWAHACTNKGNMQHAHATCNMQHATCTCNMHQRGQHATCTCNMHMQQGATHALC